jgi:serine/threonine protein phosphatase 1
MATFAIGDVHGNYQALDDLLRRLTPEIAAGDVVVFLGDYIDRGSNTRACIDRILEFQGAIDAEVVGLCGNHDDWLLRTRRDYSRHTWLLATDGFRTINSYSPEAAASLREAMTHAGAAVYGDTCVLPYGLFFDAVPATHLEWFDGLRTFHHTEDCFCSHGGLDSGVRDLSQQTRHALIWGGDGFPDDYDGPETIVYGHRNEAVIGPDGWPSPRLIGRTIGIDTISLGVLTAMRLPDGRVFQSERYEDSKRD